jgi:hypothetical protein
MRMVKIEMNRRTMDNSPRDLLVYHWAAGAVPPPYHDEYEIRISGEVGILEYWSGYPGEGVESQQYRFGVDPDMTAELQAIINGLSGRIWKQNDPPRIGGDQEWLSAVAEVLIPADLCPDDSIVAGEIFVRVRGLVPDEVWGKIGKECKKSRH